MEKITDLHKMDFYINNTFDRKRSSTFKDIKVRGYFSLTNGNSITFDSSQLRYYREREYESVCFDLNEGIENAHLYTDKNMNRHLDKLLYWIREHHKRIEAKRGGGKWLEPNFICRRGIIQSLLITPHLCDSWTICAAKWRGNIYLCGFDSESYTDTLHDVMLQSPSTCWGHKFEQFILTDTVDGIPDTTQPVDQNSQFCCIFQSRLGEHSLLYSAEVDGVYADKTLHDPLPLDELKFIELKTHYIIDHPQCRKKFAKYDTIRVWGQCVPVGIQNVLYGFKNSRGIVTELATFSLTELMNLSKFYWQPTVGINFADDFLTHIASVVVKNCDETIYKFEKRSRTRVIEMTEVSQSAHSFLPDWYKYDNRY